MIEFKKILFPVDLTEASAKLADYALTMGRRFSSEIHVLYVVRTMESPRPHIGLDYIPLDSLQTAQADFVESMRAPLKKFVDTYLNDYLYLKTVVASGHTAREILRYIEENDISLVVMGTHGREGLGKVVFGSVAQRVVQNSPVPVLIINPYRDTSAVPAD